MTIKKQDGEAIALIISRIVSHIFVTSITNHKDHYKLRFERMEGVK